MYNVYQPPCLQSVVPSPAAFVGMCSLIVPSPAVPPGRVFSSVVDWPSLLVLPFSHTYNDII